MLHIVPIPKALGHLRLRPLLDDVACEDMCSVQPDRIFPVFKEWHEMLLDAVSPIPDVAPGDTVWWHCDLVHAVAPITDQQGWDHLRSTPPGDRPG